VAALRATVKAQAAEKKALAEKLEACIEEMQAEDQKLHAAEIEIEDIRRRQDPPLHS
jgi:hypothetical protein